MNWTFDPSVPDLALLYRHLDFSQQPSLNDARELERLRMIITFIHEHYMDHITLEDIASCATHVQKRVLPSV